MAKNIIMQTTAHNSLGTPVFWRQRYRQNSNGVTPNGDAKYIGYEKFCNSQQITHYISKTVPYRYIISSKGKWKVVSTLLNGDSANNLEWPWPPQITSFLCWAFLHISGMAKSSLHPSSRWTLLCWQLCYTVHLTLNRKLYRHRDRSLLC